MMGRGYALHRRYSLWLSNCIHSLLFWLFKSPKTILQPSTCNFDQVWWRWYQRVEQFPRLWPRL